MLKRTLILRRAPIALLLAPAFSFSQLHPTRCIRSGMKLVAKTTTPTLCKHIVSLNEMPLVGANSKLCWADSGTYCSHLVSLGPRSRSR